LDESVSHDKNTSGFQHRPKGRETALTTRLPNGPATTRTLSNISNGQPTKVISKMFAY
jgi:hypothetical protein